eukprot:1586665-Rhodomonas_salina.1
MSECSRARGSEGKAMQPPPVIIIIIGIIISIIIVIISTMIIIVIIIVVVVIIIIIIREGGRWRENSAGRYQMLVVCVQSATGATGEWVPSS